MKKDTELLLSIVVSVYNAERYVEECLLSLLKQDLPSDVYEVIAVDNGSRDTSASIIDRLQVEYPNLRKVTLETNQLPSGGRNAGLEAAQGKYLMFIDSDDYYYPNMLKSLVEEMEKDDLDFIHFDSDILLDGKIIEGPHSANSDVVAGMELYHANFSRRSVSWNKVYRQSFIEKHHLRFCNGILYEDDEFAFRLYSVATRVRHVAIAPYIYRENMSSITKNRDTLLTLSSNLVEINALYEDLYGEHHVVTDKLLIDEMTHIIRDNISEAYRIYKVLPHQERKIAKQRMIKFITWPMWNYMSRKKFILLKLGII